MPEIPDLELYLSALKGRILHQKLESVRLGSPFVLRTVEPPLQSAVGRTVLALRRLGKQLIFECEGELFIVIHLMVAGRLSWKKAGVVLSGKTSLAAFGFATGTLVLTEVSTKKRASIRVVQGRAALAELDRGGLEVMSAHLEAFAERLRSERHTLKRALTDPRLFAGIGNAYSDEILFEAKLSPVAMTSSLTGVEIARLFEATHRILGFWTAHLAADVGDGWPEKVTAFRPDMAVHGKYGQPCTRCGRAVQRIVYAENETNYCPGCQTHGKLLADRSLSRLLKEDWPKTLSALEEYVATREKSR